MVISAKWILRIGPGVVEFMMKPGEVGYIRWN